MRCFPTKLTRTTNYTDLLNNNGVGMWQESFQLTALQFEYIKNGKSQIQNWSTNLFIASIGYILIILAKILSNILGEAQTISNLEKYVIVITISIAIILFLIDHFIPSNRQKTMKQIQKHFENSPAQQQSRKEN